MTNEELSMLKEVFSTAGAIGSQGFEALVRYTFVDGLTWLIGGSVVFMLAMCAVTVATSKESWSGDARAFLSLFGAFFGLISVVVILGNVADVLEPTGTTVRDLLNTAARK